MPALDLDWRLRLAAFHALDRLRKAGDGLVTGGQRTYGFEFEGERIPFFNLRMGIWKPRPADAALTIVTAPPKPGKKPPYDDQVGSHDDWFLYRYQGTDPEYWTNAAVRRAMVERRPIIDLYGIAPAA